MDILTRLQTCRLLLEMESHPEYSKRIGLIDTSYYTSKEKPAVITEAKTTLPGFSAGQHSD